MSQSFAEDVDFGTSTSVSSLWEGDFAEVSAEPTASTAILVVTMIGEESLFKKIGQTETLQAVDRCMKRVLRAAESFGGRTLETRAGEMVIDFGQADLAMLAAIEMQNRVTILPPVSGVKLALRIGLSCGRLSEEAGTSQASITETATSLAHLAEPAQIVACVRAQAALSEDLRTRFDAYCAEWNNSKTAALEILSGQSASRKAAAPAPAVHPQEEADQQPRCLKLSFEGKTYVLDDDNPVITIGRQQDNRVVLTGSHASRRHASISRRGNKVVFSDTSTNGTFISFNNAPPNLLVNKSECVLHGSGVLSFSTSHSAKGPGLVSAKFEVLSKTVKPELHLVETQPEAAA